MATAAELVKMNDKETRVREALEKAESSARGVSLPATVFQLASIFTPLLSVVPDVLKTDAQDAALANIRTARKRYEVWSDSSSEQGHRRWAERGTEPDGYLYPLSQWEQEGDDLLSEVGVHVKALEEGGNAAVVRNTVQQTATDLSNLPLGKLPEFWPEAWKRKARIAAWVLGGAATVGVVAWGAVQLAPVVTAVNSVRRKEEHVRG